MVKLYTISVQNGHQKIFPDIWHCNPFLTLSDQNSNPERGFKLGPKPLSLHEFEP